MGTTSAAILFRRGMTSSFSLAVKSGALRSKIKNIYFRTRIKELLQY
jgi:hypothetical protein